jgi:hypothetical protein
LNQPRSLLTLDKDKVGWFKQQAPTRSMFIWQIITNLQVDIQQGMGNLHTNHFFIYNVVISEPIYRTILYIPFLTSYKTLLRKVLLRSKRKKNKVNTVQFLQMPAAIFASLCPQTKYCIRKNSFLKTSFSIVFLLLHWFLPHFRLQHVVHTRLRGPLSAIATADAIAPLLC